MAGVSMMASSALLRPFLVFGALRQAFQHAVKTPVLGLGWVTIASPAPVGEAFFARRPPPAVLTTGTFHVPVVPFGP